MLPFDDHPGLGPLRTRQAVLPGVMARGRALRRRRRLVLAGPAGAASAIAVVALMLSHGSPLSERLRTIEPGGPDRSRVTAGPQGVTPPDAATSPGTVGGPGASDDGSPGAPSADSPGAITGRPGPGGPPPSASGAQSQPPAACVTPGPNAPPHPARFTCYTTNDPPQGNYVGANPNARGCVVHDTASQTSVTWSPSEFFCRYVAVSPGGWTSDGVFNFIRITRTVKGHTIWLTYDGSDANYRCEPTAFIQPGDQVYVDGRDPRTLSQSGTSLPPPGYRYTTTSVGDVFHC